MSHFARSIRALFCCIKADLYGSWRTTCCYIGAAIILFGLLALSGWLQAAADGIEGPKSFGDVIAYFFSGSKPFVFTRERFEFPIGWFVMMMLVTHMTLWYPFRDIRGFGTLVLSRCYTRWSWWVGKCVWVALCVLAFFAAACIVAYIAVVFGGGARNLALSPSFLTMMDISYISPEQAQQSLSSFLVGAPFAVMGCCLVQLFVSLLFGPTISYVFTSSMLTLSVLIGNPLLWGDHLMFLRAASSDGAIAGSVVDAAALLLWLTIACVGGGIVFSRTDLMGGDSSGD